MWYACVRARGLRALFVFVCVCVFWSSFFGGGRWFVLHQTCFPLEVLRPNNRLVCPLTREVQQLRLPTTPDQHPGTHLPAKGATELSLGQDDLSLP